MSNVGCLFGFNKIRRATRDTPEIHTLKFKWFYIFLFASEAKDTYPKEKINTIKVQPENDMNISNRTAVKNWNLHFATTVRQSNKCNSLSKKVPLPMTFYFFFRFFSSCDTTEFKKTLTLCVLTLFCLFQIIPYLFYNLNGYFSGQNHYIGFVFRFVIIVLNENTRKQKEMIKAHYALPHPCSYQKLRERRQNNQSLKRKWWILFKSQQRRLLTDYLNSISLTAEMYTLCFVIPAQMTLSINSKYLQGVFKVQGQWSMSFAWRISSVNF